MWYARDILGLRRSADGLIYDMFDSAANTYEDGPAWMRYGTQRAISCDYGTTNDCVFLDVYDDGETVWVDREYRWASRQEHRQKTDTEYADDLVEFMGEPDCAVLVDPSAASFIAELRSRGVYVLSAENDVLNGIRRVSQLFHMRKLLINRRCSGLIDELGVYSWDDKAAARGEEKPVKERDHGADALRYFCNHLPDWRFEGVQTT